MLLSRLLEPLFFPLLLGSFSLHVGHGALIVLIFSATLLYAGSPTVWLWASLAACLDQITFLIIREESYGFYSAPSVWGSIIAVGALLGCYAALRAYAGPSPRTLLRTGWKEIGLFVALLLLVIAGFRLSQAWMLEAGIPNEARSFRLAGFEIHHINHGLLLVWITSLGLQLVRVRPRVQLLLRSLLAIGIALIIDQISYYALVDITDEAYFGPASLAGALAASGLSTGLLLWLRRRR